MMLTSSSFEERPIGYKKKLEESYAMDWTRVRHHACGMGEIVNFRRKGMRSIASRRKVTDETLPGLPVQAVLPRLPQYRNLIR